MQSRTGLIEAIIFEVKDTERIGGNFLKNNSNVLCCNPKLSAERSCTVGEVIIQKDENNPEWPKRIQTFFEGNNQEVKMTPQSVEIDKTGMYYLYFMYCDPQLKGTTITGKTVWRNPDGSVDDVLWVHVVSLSYSRAWLVFKICAILERYNAIALSYLGCNCSWDV